MAARTRLTSADIEEQLLRTTQARWRKGQAIALKERSLRVMKTLRVAGRLRVSPFISLVGGILVMARDDLKEHTTQ